MEVIEIRCPRKGCNGRVKDNGWGFNRCRKCDTEFTITYLPGCKHYYQTHHGIDGNTEKCVLCGEDKDDTE